MKVKKILAMALLTAGVLAASCSSEDNIADEPQTQQPAAGAITFTATLSPKGDDGGQTRAITPGTDTDANLVPLSLESKNRESEFGFCLYFSYLVGVNGRRGHHLMTIFFPSLM